MTLEVKTTSKRNERRNDYRPFMGKDKLNRPLPKPKSYDPPLNWPRRQESHGPETKLKPRYAEEPPRRTRIEPTVISRISEDKIGHNPRSDGYKIQYPNRARLPTDKEPTKPRTERRGAFSRFEGGQLSEPAKSSTTEGHFDEDTMRKARDIKLSDSDVKKFLDAGYSSKDFSKTIDRLKTQYGNDGARMRLKGDAMLIDTLKNDYCKGSPAATKDVLKHYKMDVKEALVGEHTKVLYKDSRQKNPGARLGEDAESTLDGLIKIQNAAKDHVTNLEMNVAKKVYANEEIRRAFPRERKPKTPGTSEAGETRKKKGFAEGAF